MIFDARRTFRSNPFRLAPPPASLVTRGQMTRGHPGPRRTPMKNFGSLRPSVCRGGWAYLCVPPRSTYGRIFHQPQRGRSLFGHHRTASTESGKGRETARPSYFVGEEELPLAMALLEV